MILSALHSGYDIHVSRILQDVGKKKNQSFSGHLCPFEFYFLGMIYILSHYPEGDEKKLKLYRGGLSHDKIFYKTLYPLCMVNKKQR